MTRNPGAAPGGSEPTGGSWSHDQAEPNPDRHAAVELRHLAALEAIAVERSFRGAALRLGYVQSAVSHQLAALERIVGARLVERSRRNRPVALTRAGQLMLAHATNVLTESRCLLARLDEQAERSAGVLRVGAFQSVANNLLPKIMPAFAERCPGVRLVVVERKSDTSLLALLRSGEVDLAFCGLPVPTGPFGATEVMEDPYVALVRADGPLAERHEPLRLDELHGLPLIGFSDSRAQTLLTQRLADIGILASFRFVVDMNSTMQSMVAEGIGVAVVPYLTIDPLIRATTVVEIAELPARRIGIAWHEESPPGDAATRFIELARAVAPRFRARASHGAS
jgi:DNA-binding transcriptional LysR family regulator